MKVKVPTSLSEMTVGNYLKFLKVSAEPDFDQQAERLALVCLFCDLTLEQALTISQKDLITIAGDIKKLLIDTPEFIQRFTMDGQEFGFIPNLDQMTAAEYIDLDTYLSDPETYVEVLAVLYRPVLKLPLIAKYAPFRDKSLYNIQPYKSARDHREKMLHAPLSVLLGALVFFYTLRTDLLKAVRESLQKGPEAAARIGFQKNGTGINQLIQSLEAAERISSTPWLWTYTHF